VAATTLPLQQIKGVGTISGNQFRVSPPYQVASGQTIAAGDVVTFAAGVASVSASPVPAANTVAGVSLHGAKQGTAWYLVPLDGSGSPQQEDTGGTFGGTFMSASSLMGSLEGLGVHVMDANPDTIFQATLVQAIALSQIGVQVGLVKNSGVWQADTSQATKTALIIGIPNFVGVLYPAGPVNPIPTTGVTGDLNYPVWIQFLPTATLLGI
jgi:hypothetical protein